MYKLRNENSLATKLIQHTKAIPVKYRREAKHERNQGIKLLTHIANKKKKTFSLLLFSLHVLHLGINLAIYILYLPLSYFC